MALNGMYRGYIGFFLKRGNGLLTDVRWVKGNMQPWRTETLFTDYTGGFEVWERSGRTAFTTTNPFPEYTTPDDNMFFIDPLTDKSYKVSDVARWTTMSGRSPKHFKWNGSRDKPFDFPTSPTTTPTPTSVERYERAVLNVQILTSIFIKGV